MPLLIDYETTGSGRRVYILKDLDDQLENKIFQDDEEYLCTEPVWAKTFTTPQGLARAITNYFSPTGRAVANIRKK